MDSRTVRMEKSVDDADIKTATFTDNLSLSCTYFVKKGIPDEKICTIRIIMKAEPSSKAVVIASSDINLSMHFGEDY